MLFLPEHMKKKKYTFRYASLGFLIPIILYILTYIIVVGALTAPEVKTLIWPTISLFQSFELKGIFIERFESFYWWSGLSSFSPHLSFTDTLPLTG